MIADHRRNLGRSPFSRFASDHPTWSGMSTISSWQNLGRSGNSEILDRLGFSRHMKTSSYCPSLLCFLWFVKVLKELTNQIVCCHRFPSLVTGYNNVTKPITWRVKCVSLQMVVLMRQAYFFCRIILPLWEMNVKHKQTRRTNPAQANQQNMFYLMYIHSLW